MNQTITEDTTFLITNAQVLERIRQSSTNKTPETARIDVVIPRAFLRLNGQPPEMAANPEFYDCLEGFLEDRDASKHGIALPRKYDERYISRIAALVPAYRRVQAEGQYEPGPFPITALSREQQRIVESVAKVYEVPVELAGMAALAVTAAALGKGWKLKGAVNGKENYGNLYVIAAARSAAGKSVADELSAPFADASDRLRREWETKEMPRLQMERQLLSAKARRLVSIHTRQALAPDEMAAIESELLRTNEQLERIKPLLDCSPRYLIGDATSEALAMQFARSNDTLFACSSEAGQIIRVLLGRYVMGDNADFDLWLSGYSVQRCNSDRATRRSIDVVPCLSALLCCQPSVLRELWNNEEALERGLTGRVLAFTCRVELKEDDGQERRVPEGRRKAWTELVEKLLHRRSEILRAGDSHLVDCSPEAREILRHFHNISIRLRNGELNNVEEQLGRWRENACRIGLGLCIADDPYATTLTGEQAQRAVQIARWAQLSALQVMRTEQNKQTGKILKRQELDRLNRLCTLASASASGITLRDLWKSHGFSRPEIQRLVEDFPQRLRLEVRQNPKGGPQSLVLKPVANMAESSH